MFTLVLWAATLLPPRLMQISNAGCTVVQDSDRWKLLVWVQYQNGQGWASWYKRPKKDPSKLMPVCDGWLEQVEHAVRGRA